MHGFTAEYDIIALVPLSTRIGSNTTLSGSAVDMSPYIGPAKLIFGFASGTSDCSIVPSLEFCEDCTTAVSADSSGTWSAWTTAPYATPGSVINNNSMIASLTDIKGVEGKFIRARIINNQVVNTLVATGILITRKQDN